MLGPSIFGLQGGHLRQYSLNIPKKPRLPAAAFCGTITRTVWCARAEMGRWSPGFGRNPPGNSADHEYMARGRDSNGPFPPAHGIFPCCLLEKSRHGQSPKLANPLAKGGPARRPLPHGLPPGLVGDARLPRPPSRSPTSTKASTPSTRSQSKSGFTPIQESSMPGGRGSTAAKDSSTWPSPTTPGRSSWEPRSPRPTWPAASATA